MTAMEMVEKAQLTERPRMKAGDTVKVHVRVKEGDKERIQIFEGIIIGLRRGGNRATGTVRPKRGRRRLDAMVHQPAYWVEAAREQLRARILQALPDQPYAGVLAALAIGDQRAISPDQWQVFTRTGVNHLMSISGLHVTMVSGLVFALAYALWRRSARLSPRPRRRCTRRWPVTRASI